MKDNVDMPVRAVARDGAGRSVATRNWIALGTIARREVSRILRIWSQTLVPPAITMTLYFLIFGGLIGARIGDMGGYSYMEFIVPGLVMMSVIQNSYGNISSSFFGAKFGRHVEELLVSPMPNWVILGGYVAGAVLRGLMVGVIVLCIAMLFTDVRVPHPLVTLSTVLLGATIFSLAGFVNAIYAKKFDDVATELGAEERGGDVAVAVLDHAHHHQPGDDELHVGETTHVADPRADQAAEDQERQGHGDCRRHQGLGPDAQDAVHFAAHDGDQGNKIAPGAGGFLEGRGGCVHSALTAFMRRPWPCRRSGARTVLPGGCSWSASSAPGCRRPPARRTRG